MNVRSYTHIANMPASHKMNNDSNIHAEASVLPKELQATLERWKWKK